MAGAGAGARATGAGFVALPRRAGLAGEPRERCSSAATATRLRCRLFLFPSERERPLSRRGAPCFTLAVFVSTYVGYGINGSFDNRDSKGQFFAETLTTL